MKPYYEHAGIIIYHGDCRDVMPSLKVDVVVTDPPYGTAFDGVTGDESFPFDVLPGVGSCIAFGSPKRVVDDLRAFTRRPDRVMVWAPALNISKASLGGVLYKWMPIYGWALKGVGINEPPYGDVFTDYLPFISVITKPEPLMRKLLCLTAGIVLDPFMGSGSTLVAAKSVGRAAIGIEIEERYCEVAANRLSQEVLAFGPSRCECRYPVPQTRDEPFAVTYRCALPLGHWGPHGPDAVDPVDGVVTDGPRANEDLDE